jgi:hypothetical protein
MMLLDFDTQEIWWLFERFWLQASQTVVKKHAFKASQKGKDVTSQMGFNWARQHNIALIQQMNKLNPVKEYYWNSNFKIQIQFHSIHILIESPSHPASSLDSWVVFWIGIKVGTLHLTGNMEEVCLCSCKRTNKQTNHHLWRLTTSK